MDKKNFLRSIYIAAWTLIIILLIVVIVPSLPTFAEDFEPEIIHLDDISKDPYLEVETMLETETETEIESETDIEVESISESESESETEIETEIETESQYTYLGTYSLTAYCSCSECSGPWGAQTASGSYAVSGYTVACNSLPIGTKIYIDGYGTYVVEDTGGMGPDGIDIYFDSHWETEEFGRRWGDVYLVN